MRGFSHALGSTIDEFLRQRYQLTKIYSRLISRTIATVPHARRPRAGPRPAARKRGHSLALAFGRRKSVFNHLNFALDTHTVTGAP